MKFTTALDFFKALTENNGVLWCENGYVIDLNKEESIAILGMFLLQFKKREFFTTPPLKDKDFVECWDNNDTHIRSYGFLDAVSNCTFKGDGTRGGLSWSNYRKITPLPDWAIEAQKTLED